MRRLIGRADDSKRTPETDALEPVEPAFDDELIAQFRPAPIIDLRPDDDRISFALGHLDKRQSQFFGEERARDFDETQVGDVVDDSRRNRCRKTSPATPCECEGLVQMSGQSGYMRKAMALAA